MDSPNQKDSVHLDPTEEIIEEEPQEEFEGSPSIETKRVGSRALPVASTTESTNSSRSHSLNRSQSDPPNIAFPNLILNNLNNLNRQSSARKGSLQLINPVLAVQEEEAEEKDDRDKTVKIKQIKNFVDYGEFDTANQRKSRTLDKTQYEPRARSFEKPSVPLEKVQEAKNEEERMANIHTAERKWIELKDHDEFNTKGENKSKTKPSIEAEKLIDEQKAVLESRPQRLFSLNLDDESIPEEVTKESRVRLGHFLPIHNVSPKVNKLKVDEIDFERNKSEFEQYKPEIDEEQIFNTDDVIKEDASEYGRTTQGEEILEKAKQKMSEEKEFIKKFVRNETNTEIDTMRITLEREFSNPSKNEHGVAIEEESLEKENQE